MSPFKSSMVGDENQVSSSNANSSYQAISPDKIGELVDKTSNLKKSSKLGHKISGQEVSFHPNHLVDQSAAAVGGNQANYDQLLL